MWRRGKISFYNIRKRNKAGGSLRVCWAPGDSASAAGECLWGEGGSGISRFVDKVVPYA